MPVCSFCTSAHRQAYERFRLLHKDIGYGNVLIMEDMEDNEVIQIGYLNDWEPSKVADEDITQVARQPKRTNVGFFVHHYFDVAISHNRQFYICGDKKWSTVQFGELAYANIPIKFGDDEIDSPVNKIVKRLLKWFTAYYAIVERDQSQLWEHPRIGAIGQESDPPQRGQGETYKAKPIEWTDASEETTKAQIQKLKMRADKLQGHGAMCSFFLDVLNNSLWPMNDKVPDMLPTDYNHQMKMELIGKSSTGKRSLEEYSVSQTRKKLKLATSNDVAIVRSLLFYPRACEESLSAVQYSVELSVQNLARFHQQIYLYSRSEPDWPLEPTMDTSSSLHLPIITFASYVVPISVG
ncbi:hypothetical protein BKA93DRAFT_753005 [Sparassis latifolia]